MAQVLEIRKGFRDSLKSNTDVWHKPRFLAKCMFDDRTKYWCSEWPNLSDKERIRTIVNRFPTFIYGTNKTFAKFLEFLGDDAKHFEYDKSPGGLYRFRWNTVPNEKSLVEDTDDNSLIIDVMQKVEEILPKEFHSNKEMFMVATNLAYMMIMRWRYNQRKQAINKPCDDNLIQLSQRDDEINKVTQELLLRDRYDRINSEVENSHSKE